MSAAADKTKISPKIGPKKTPTSIPTLAPLTECECDDLLEIVRGLYQKYSDDDYLKTKLTTHINWHWLTSLSTLIYNPTIAISTYD